MTRLAGLLVGIAMTGLVNSAPAQEAQPKTDFAFDPSTVLPPDRSMKPPLARVLGEYIYPEQVTGRHRGSVLRARIWGPLARRFVEQEKITASAEEIDQFVRALQRRRALPMHADSRIVTPIAREYVIDWKLSRALYERYGGAVIFQQANPLEPVGAYGSFLQEAERTSVLKFFNAKARADFWEYYTRTHPFVVRPELVDYDEPWWLESRPVENPPEH